MFEEKVRFKFNLFLILSVGINLCNMIGLLHVNLPTIH